MKKKTLAFVRNMFVVYKFKLERKKTTKIRHYFTYG